MPADDALWPVCLSHDTRHWCEGIRKYFLSGEDGFDLKPGLSFSVPVVPDHSLYAEVIIDQNEVVIPDFSWRMFLVKNEPWSIMQGDMIYLGDWHKDDGRMAIGLIIENWKNANGPRDHKCTSSSHGYEEEVFYQDYIRPQYLTWGRTQEWCLAFYKMCYACLRSRRAQAERSGQAGRPDPTTWSASSFGLQADNFLQRDQQAATASQRNTLDLLKNRHGNGSRA